MKSTCLAIKRTKSKVVKPTVENQQGRGRGEIEQIGQEIRIVCKWIGVKPLVLAIVLIGR